MNRKGCLVAMALPALLTVWYIIYTWPETHHYRYAIEIETPAGLRIGSTVIAVTSRRQVHLLPDQGHYSSAWQGEAAAVDLPGKPTLFALLEQDGSLGLGYITSLALGPKESPKRRIGAPPTEMRIHVGGAHSGMSYQEGIPMLVRFQDINDPRTIEKVDPDNLAASFGPGFRLRRITVQVTDAPTTIGILNRFPWWKKYTNRWFNGDKCCSVNRLSKDISSRVSVHSFSTEWKDNFYE